MKRKAETVDVPISKKSRNDELQTQLEECITKLKNGEDVPYISNVIAVPNSGKNNGKLHAKDLKYLKHHLLFNVKSKEAKGTKLKPLCKWVGDRIFMTCVSCKASQPRTPLYFQTDRVSTFETAQAGYEALRNSPSAPCKKCYSKITIKRVEPKMTPEILKQAKDCIVKLEKKVFIQIISDAITLTKKGKVPNHRRKALAYHFLIMEKAKKRRAEQIEQPKLKSGCKWNGDGIYMKCVGCNEDKPRTTLFFTPDNKASNFLSCDAGYESLLNNNTLSCLICSAKKCSDYCKTRDGFIRSLLIKYPAITRAIYEAAILVIEGKCPLTGHQMPETSNAEFAVGIHNLNNDDPSHSTFFLACQEANCSQHDAIPCLFEAWTSLITNMLFDEPVEVRIARVVEFKKNYKQTPQENGVTAPHSTKEYNKQMKELHLPLIISDMVAAHVQGDLRIQLLPAMSTANRRKLKKKVQLPLFNKLIAQAASCKYGNVPLSIKNAWNRFSMERLDNSKPHFTPDGDISNIVFICRMINTRSTGWNRKKLLETVLTQPLVPVTDANRAIVSAQIALI